MTINNAGIDRLEEIVDSLPAAEKALFQRIYAVDSAIGEMRFPKGVPPRIKQQFGSVKAVTRQKIVKVTNKITYKGTLFNGLRASRPMEIRESRSIDAQFLSASDSDSFSHPEDSTPEDLFGRVVGKHCVTASNIAKYDGLHSIVIFNDFNPLRFSREQVIDYIDVGWEWARRAHASQPEARYFFFIWNCLWRAGASVYHGHAQVMLARERHYAQIEGLRQAALDYRQKYGTSYFSDLFQVHYSVGCALEKEGVKILAHLTPFKDNEVILIAEGLNIYLKERVYEVLASFRDKLGITSFNLSLVTPPLGETEESWEGFPVMVRMVDRGDLNSRTSDIGSMEIYAASVASSDPLELARQLQ